MDLLGFGWTRLRRDASARQAGLDWSEIWWPRVRGKISFRKVPLLEKLKARTSGAELISVFIKCDLAMVESLIFHFHHSDFKGLGGTNAVGHA